LDGEQIIPLYAGKTIQWRKVWQMKHCQ
jgi:hypothetical protein